MTGLLNLHRLAAMRGDGLHPRLLELLEQRATLAPADGKVVEIDRLRDGAFTQAGPPPQSGTPDFLPGNVVSFTTEAATRLAAERRKAPSV